MKEGFVIIFLTDWKWDNRHVCELYYDYRKVANSSLSWLVARFYIFRMLMKGKFDAYVL